MASFYAELELAGRIYPVRACRFDFRQSTDHRGRVRAKVRHGLVYLTLDVPTDDALLAWAAAPHKALAGHVTFFAVDQLMARETMSFAAGHCVGYTEIFSTGDAAAGAYVCQLVVVAERLELVAGGSPRPYVAAPPREYAIPPRMP